MKKFTVFLNLFVFAVVLVSAQQKLINEKDITTFSNNDCFDEVVLNGFYSLNLEEIKNIHGGRPDWRSIGGGAGLVAGGYAVLCGGDLYKDIHRKFVRPTYRIVRRASRRNRNWQRWTFHGSW